MWTNNLERGKYSIQHFGLTILTMLKVRRMIDHMYSAIRGKGARLNGSKVHKTGGVKNISKAMMIMELPMGANKDKTSVAMANLGHMMGKAHAVRAPGPAALDIAWVGAGSADCYFHIGKYYNLSFENNSLLLMIST